MRKEYINRYGDKFTFEVNERGNIDWKGDFKYVRYSFQNNSDDLVMVDPSGGPYIELETNMKLFGLEGIVVGFIKHEDYYELVVEK